MISSYKSAFLVVFTAMMVITVVSVGSNAYRRAAEISFSLSSDVIGEMSDKIVNRTVGIFEAADLYLETNAALFPGRGDGVARDRLLRLFWRQLQLKPQLLSMYVADPGGNLLQVRVRPQLLTRTIDRTGDASVEQLVYRDSAYEPIAHIDGNGQFDPLGRPWYTGAAQASGAVYWSPVYRFYETSEAGVTAAKAVYGQDGELQAVLGIDIALRSLSEFLAEQRDTRGALALIIDRDDNLVAAPYQLELSDGGAGGSEALGSIEQLSDGWLVEAYRTLKGGDELSAPDGGYRSVSHGDKRYITHLHRFPDHWSDGWQLLIAVPEASLLAATGRLLSESVVISLIILIAAVLLVYFLAMRLFEPMRRLVHNTELIKQFRLQEVRPVASRFEEIEAMDQAIYSMRTGLQRLAKFLPPTVARDLIQSGEEPEPGGEVVELTLFFSAMAEFSALMVKLPPERVTALLARSLDEFTRMIHRYGGTIDNYLGESIMAFWGAPVSVADGPQRACRAALRCVRVERELRRKDPKSFPTATRNLFAIHRGPAIVGNIGSSARMAYTAIGDSVEFAWNLRQLNHRYGTRIIVSEPVHAVVAEQFWLRRLDVIHLQGRSEGLPIYELLGERSEALANDVHEFVRSYEAGLEALEAAAWDEATPIFERLAEARPADPSVKLMRLRCSMRDTAICPRLTASGAEVPNEAAVG